MDVLAHALWVGAGVTLARRRWPFSPRIAALTVALAVAPDVPHLLPIMAWSVFGEGTIATVTGYAYAIPSHVPVVPPVVDSFSHHLYCTTHSAIIAAVVTLLMWVCLRRLWIPLLGWWTHIVIDVFTHSADYFPAPLLYPITREGFDGVAWNAPWFMALNYAALATAYLWLWRTWRGARS